MITFIINIKHNKHEIVKKMPSLIMNNIWTNKLIDCNEGHIDHLEVYVSGPLDP